MCRLWRNQVKSAHNKLSIVSWKSCVGCHPFHIRHSRSFIHPILIHYSASSRWNTIHHHPLVSYVCLCQRGIRAAQMTNATSLINKVSTVGCDNNQPTSTNQTYRATRGVPPNSCSHFPSEQYVKTIRS